MVFVFPIMDRRVRPSGRSYSLRARRGRLGGRTRAKQTQDAGVLEAGHGRPGGRTRASWRQDAGVLEAGRERLGGRTRASWRQDAGSVDTRRGQSGCNSLFLGSTVLLKITKTPISHPNRYILAPFNTTTCQTRLQSMTVFDEISGVQDKISGVQVCRLSPNLKVELVLNNVCKTC